MPTKISSGLVPAPATLTGAELLEIVQSGVSYNVTVTRLRGWIYLASVNTTSGTTISLTTGIPSTATQIEIFFNGVSTNTAAQPPIVRLGDSGGIETTGYSGVVRGPSGETYATNGFYTLRTNAYVAADTIYGVMRLARWDTSLQLWFSDCICNDGNADWSSYSGRKTTSDVMDRISLTTPGGTATFDAGSARVRYR
jgi:hypothetical protein